MTTQLPAVWRNKVRKTQVFFEYWTATQAHPDFSQHLNYEMSAASGWGLASHTHASPYIPNPPKHSSITYVGYCQEDTTPRQQGCPEQLISHLISSGMIRNDEEAGKGSGASHSSQCYKGFLLERWTPLWGDSIMLGTSRLTDTVIGGMQG